MKHVTFDTNTFGILNPNDNRVSEELKIIGEEIRKRIIENRIKGYISEASVFIECLGFEEKLVYLAVAGTRGNRPPVDPRGIAAINELGNLGFELLHAPLIGAEIFIERVPWAKDERHPQAERLDRFGDCCRRYGHPHKTIHELRDYGNSLLPKNSAGSATRKSWDVALKSAWDNGDKDQKKALRSKINPIISEWCDILIISSHLAYGNDIFCTNDKGTGAGSISVLHGSNRNHLQQDGIEIMTPIKLLESL